MRIKHHPGSGPWQRPGKATRTRKGDQWRNQGKQWEEEARRRQPEDTHSREEEDKNNP